WGYFAPDSALIMAPTREDTLKLNIKNWLKIRSEWRYILEDDKLRTPIAARTWRAFLRSHNAQDSEVLAKFRDAWGVGGAVVMSNEPTWHGALVSDNEIDATFCKGITWELCRLNFRYELLTIDSIIVRRTGPDAPDIAAQRLRWINDVLGNDLRTEYSERPVADTGLAARNIQDRVHSLEALRQLMQCWPNRPLELGDIQTPMHTLDVSAVQQIEKAIARFYIQTYTRHSNRPPVLLCHVV
ncbi:hypothetical protein BC629DRAFT_1295995, partial [Irpex lacteus]